MPETVAAISRPGTLRPENQYPEDSNTERW